MKAGTCKHFLGIQRVCEAGIDPHTVRCVNGPGPARWPCLPNVRWNGVHREATTSCPSFVALTEAEADAIMVDLEAAARKAFGS